MFGTLLRAASDHISPLASSLAFSICRQYTRNIRAKSKSISPALVVLLRKTCFVSLFLTSRRIAKQIIFPTWRQEDTPHSRSTSLREQATSSNKHERGRYVTRERTRNGLSRPPREVGVIVQTLLCNIARGVIKNIFYRTSGTSRFVFVDGANTIVNV